MFKKGEMMSWVTPTSRKRRPKLSKDKIHETKKYFEKIDGKAD